MYNMTWADRAGQAVLKTLDNGPDGKKRITYTNLPIKPYFFVPRDSLDDMAKSVLKDIDHFTSFEETNAVFRNIRLFKVEMSRPDYVREAREKLLGLGVTTYEADIPYARRVMIDMDITVEQPKHTLFFDIEVDSTTGFPQPEQANARILTIACVDEEGNGYTYGDDSEVETIHQFLKLTERFEVVSGYNSDLFDMPYLMNRCRKLGIYFDWFAFVHIDLLPIYKLMSIRKRPSDYKLDTVCEEELGERKVKTAWGMKDIFEVFKDKFGKRKELIDYNLQDARLTKKLNDKYNIIGILFSIAQFSHTTVPSLINAQKLGHGLNNSTAVDGVILSIALRRNPRIVFPTKVHLVENPESFPGAIVFEPIPGRHENVANLDFSSLYPSVIKTFNIGQDTYCKEGDAPIKGAIGSFYREPKSILAEAIEMMGKKRAEYKSARDKADPATKQWQTLYAQEYAVKQLLLSFYGVIGYQGSRYFDLDIASNVTMLGQEFVKKAKEIAEARGHEVVYGDTDSLFLKFVTHSGDIVEDAKKLADIINPQLRTWAKEKFGVENFMIEMDVERIFSSIIMFEAKKRYAGIVIWQAGSPTCYMYVVGLELKRRDWPKAAGEFQNEVLKMVLTSKSKKEVVSFVKKTKERLFSGELDQKLVIYKGMNQDIEDYKTNAPHIRAAKKMVEAGHQVKMGDKIAYIRVGTDPGDVQPVIDDKVPHISQKGYQFVWENQFVPIQQRLGILKIDMKAIDSQWDEPKEESAS